MLGSMAPEAAVASQEVLQRIDKVSKRRFHDENEAEECALYILEGLREENCRRLRSYEGRSSYNTFLCTLINSLASDFYRKRYGRKRIPKAVSKLGAWAEALYQLVCWKSHSVSDAYEIFCLHQGYNQTFDTFLDEMEPVLKAPCPKDPKVVSLDDPEGHTDHLSDANQDPFEAMLEKLDQERRIRALGIIRDATSALPDEDQILLKLRFEADKPLPQIGLVLGLSENAARKKLKSILTHFKAQLLSVGIREA
jgi:RNA polymerase sigma factor (sigma-70 family)